MFGRTAVRQIYSKPSLDFFARPKFGGVYEASGDAFIWFPAKCDAWGLRLLKEIKFLFGETRRHLAHHPFWLISFPIENKCSDDRRAHGASNEGDGAVHRSISPNTTSRDPSTALTSASWWPLQRWSMAARCG